MPRIPPLDRAATYEDPTKVPDTMVAEIVDGELHATPRPALVDPAARTLEVLRLEAGRWTILSTTSS